MTGELQETAPCAAITEKRPNRLSGCVGVFFQLFDWNRRFAKKKLFSRKSLLPGKQASKRFGGSDKMLKSKINLIDDENRGGFPNRGELMELKKHEMKSPSLVARLMGLESIPSTHREKGKKKKPPFSQNNDRCNLFDGEEDDNGFDKSRPQKMQRTIGVCDRRVVAKKFGSDAMQIKNVLTRVRKHHQPQKLASPVRSPRLNRRNSRLIDAAARILEPGKRNAKGAIAYPGSSRIRGCETAGKEPVEVVVSPDSLEFQSGYNNSVASCKACGSLVDVHGSSLVTEKTGKNMACVSESTPFQRSKRNVFWRNQEASVSVSPKGRDSTYQMERKALHLARYDCNGKHDEMVPPGVRNRSDFHNQMLLRKRLFPEASYTGQSKRGASLPANAINCKDKDFIAMNRGSTSRNHHLKAPAKFENSDMNLQRNSLNRVEESCKRSGLSTSARKRRLACVTGHGQGTSLMSPGSNRLDGECSCACSNETAFSPLKLGSPHRSYNQCCRETKERKGVQHVQNHTGERNSKTSFQKKLPLDGGTLGLIQQKLKEIVSQEEDEDRGGVAFPNKSASLILHELLSSLALEQPYMRDIDMSHAEPASQRKRKTEIWSSMGNANSDYTSPGSVLDASFSNESCFSNSFDNISVPGQMRLPLELIEPDWDILEDSANSFKNSATGGTYKAIASLVSHVSNVLRSLSNTGLILTLQRFTYAREVIIHTELLVGSTTQETYLIGPELFDELMIYAARSDHLVNLPGLTGGFLVDAMIEHLEQRNISCGLNPLSAKADELIQCVLEEVPKWVGLAPFDMEEVIGTELESHLFGVGSEIAYEILWCLVGELATDLGKPLQASSIHLV